VARTPALRTLPAPRIVRHPGPAPAAPAPHDPYKLNRRHTDRSAIEGTATALFSGLSDRFAITTVALIDSSPTGLGLFSLVPVEPGQRVTFGSSTAPLPAHTGTVVHCLPACRGHRLGIRFDPRRAA
jgi:hypothetical protein